MKCDVVKSEDGRAFCKSHGVYMDPLMSGPDVMCPLGYISHVERRFESTQRDLLDEISAFRQSLVGFRERLAVIEGELGIPDPDLIPDDE